LCLRGFCVIVWLHICIYIYIYIYLCMRWLLCSVLVTYLYIHSHVLGFASPFPLRCVCVFVCFFRFSARLVAGSSNRSWTFPLVPQIWSVCWKSAVPRKCCTLLCVSPPMMSYPAGAVLRLVAAPSG
jgi:hypothetical protein